MIPCEVADIADLIDPQWSQGTDEDMQFTLEAAWRIYNAGYRKESEPETATIA